MQDLNSLPSLTFLKGLIKMLLRAYPAIFHPEENGGFFIEFPDIQGAYTGINENDVTLGLTMAEEVLGMVLADYIENDDIIPEATPINKISMENGSFVTLVKVDIEKYFKDTTPVKKTLTIPSWADKTAKRLGLNFSQTLTEAILEKTKPRQI